MLCRLCPINYQRCSLENPILFSVSKPAPTEVLINSRTIQLFVSVFAPEAATRPKTNAAVVAGT